MTAVKMSKEDNYALILAKRAERDTRRAPSWHELVRPPAKVDPVKRTGDFYQREFPTQMREVEAEFDRRNRAMRRARLRGRRFFNGTLGTLSARRTKLVRR